MLTIILFPYDGNVYRTHMITEWSPSTSGAKWQIQGSAMLVTKTRLQYTVHHRAQNLELPPSHAPSVRRKDLLVRQLIRTNDY